MSDGTDRAPAASGTPVSRRPDPAWRADAFHAPAWARSPHVQTLAGKALRPAPSLPLRRERWETPDGDFLDLDFVEGPPGPPAPLVLVLHGLEGHARRGYVGTALGELHARGMAGVGLNFRGCSGEPNRTPRAYHSGETGDLGFVLDRLRERHPARPFAALGFSLGGNVLLKLLGEQGEDVRDRLHAAAAISVPYDLAAGAGMLERTPMGRLYTRYFLRSLVAKVREKRSVLEGRIELDAAVRSRTIREFDERVTAPLHGFRDAGHYYRVSSSAGFLDAVRIPTLLLHARDDPFLPPDRIPEGTARRNPFVRAVITERGGHVGFVEGTPWDPGFWGERTVADFFARHLKPGEAYPQRGGRLDRRPPIR